MNRNTGMLLIAVVAFAVAAIVAWQKSGSRDTGTAPAPREAPVPVQQATPPEPPETSQAALVEVTEELVEEPVQESEEEPAASPEPPKPGQDDPFGGKAITAETLAGCTYTQGRLEIEFAPNGIWKVNGNPRAKWRIEGGRVRMYDDKGEEHFLDIAGNKLLFNGEEIKVTR